MHNLRHFLHFHKGSPEDRIFKILGAFFLILTLVMWASSNSSRAAHEETIKKLSMTVPEPTFATTQVSTPTYVSSDPVSPSAPCTPELRDETLFDIKQKQKNLATMTQELKRINGKTPLIPRLTEARNVTLTFEELIYQAPNLDVMCRSVENYWRNPVHDEVNNLQRLYTIPKRLNRTFALTQGLKQELGEQKTKNNLKSTGVSTETLASFVTGFEQEHEQALRAYQHNQFETADQMLAGLEENDNPSELTAAIGLLNTVAEKTKNTRNLSTSNRIFQQLKPTIVNINNGSFSIALETLRSVADRL